MRAVAFILAALLSSTAHADNLFEQTDDRSRSVNATVYMTDGDDTLICYGAECWLSNGRSLGYRYSVTAQLRDVPTCVAGRGDCPDVYLNDDVASEAAEPLQLN